MAVKASAVITLSSIRDLQSCTRYYLLQSSTSAKPAKPTANPPGGSWVTAEPGYTAGSTNSLYICDLNVFSDGDYAYSDVSLSSSYEAAKAAYNKAQAAQTTASAAQDSVDGLEIGGRNLILRTKDYKDWYASKTQYITYPEPGVVKFSASGLTAISYSRVEGPLSVESADVIGDDEYVLSFDAMSPDWSSVSEPTTSNAGLGGAMVTFVTADTPTGTQKAYRTARLNASKFWREVPSATDGEWLRFVSMPLKFGADNKVYDSTGTVWADFAKSGIGQCMRFGPQLRANGTVYFRNLKFEKGNRATDWTPAPEDVDAGISAAQETAEAAADAVEALDNALTQQEIFNRLTDNGAAQGMVLYNGQLYVNASYIQSGTLTLGGANNGNGTLRVLNASGDEVGAWTKDGIDATSGSIGGWQILDHALQMTKRPSGASGVGELMYIGTAGMIYRWLPETGGNRRTVTIGDTISITNNDDGDIRGARLAVAGDTGDNDDELKLQISADGVTWKDVFVVGESAARALVPLSLSEPLAEPLAVDSGGTGAANVADARANLGVVIMAASTIAIPAFGSSASYKMDKLTADHQVVLWNFSASAENSPPCDLTITTYAGYFTITNTSGSTSETVQPVFAIPTEITVTAR